MSYGRQLRRALLGPTVDAAALEESLRAAQSRMPVPVLWLLGKTQAGKTSIIRALTGSAEAEIGNGFQPCTRTARFYDFPPGTPVVRFLDTRGLGETNYEPDEDLRYCEVRAHLVVAVMKVADLAQEAVFDVLGSIRGRHPDWPVLLVQTGLHELYPPGFEHLVPWPYECSLWPESVPEDLRRALTAQRALARRLPGSGPLRWVAIDFTMPEDGYEPADYGLEALWEAVEATSSFELRRQLAADPGVRDLYARSAHLQTAGHAAAAAGLGALPVVDLVAVTAVQAKLLHALALLYGQRLDRQTAAELLGLLGAGFATAYVARMLGRGLAKLVPVWGQTLGAVWGASASGATTYALGRAAEYFFARRRDGLPVESQVLRQVYGEALAAGRDWLRERSRSRGP